MLSTTQQEMLLIGTMNIGFPTADTYSDWALMHQLYRGYPYHPNCDINAVPLNLTKSLTIYKACLAGVPEEQRLYNQHPTWATMLLVPFLLNYMAGWYTWYQVDKSKKFTWLACLLGVYPQLRAANVIRELRRNPRRGLAKKREFERVIGEKEVFLESSHWVHGSSRFK